MQRLFPLIQVILSVFLLPALFASKQRFSASLSALVVGRRYANAARTATVCGYPLLTLHTGWKASRRLSVFAMIDNLLDHRYEVLPGYIMPRINAAGGFTISF
jgi:outer membrane cobalamin receptor